MAKAARESGETSAPAGDPLAELTPTARRLVSAARRLLAREGFEALTVEAVAAEAGAYRDAVRYYFGSKAAFVATVVDSLAHDQSLEGALRTRDLPAGPERVRALMDADRRLAEDLGSFRDFFTILPHALRDDELRERVARLYDWYRSLYVEALDGEDEARRAALEAYAHLMAAMTDGLAVQKLLDPTRVDLTALYALWTAVLEGALAGLAGPEAPARRAGGETRARRAGDEGRARHAGGEGRARGAADDRRTRGPVDDRP